MKSRFTKLCAMVLTLTMVMTSLTGLTSALADDGLVDINVMVYDRGHEYTGGNSLTDNEFTRWVNSQMEPQGVHVNYVPVPRSGADDKINLMLTAGTASGWRLTPARAACWSCPPTWSSWIPAIRKRLRPFCTT